MNKNFAMPQPPAGLPDPLNIIDSIADGFIEVAEVPVKTAEGIAGVATLYAAGARSNLNDLKSRMPDDPSVIPDVAMKAASQTVRAGIGLVQSFANSFTSGLNGVQSQIRRVTG